MVLFGPEFTFTNDQILSSSFSESQALQTIKLNEWKNELLKICKTDCSIEAAMDKHGLAYKIIFNDGWYFKIALDKNVLEVQTKPSTVLQFYERKDLINQMIFGISQKLNLKPHDRIGGGHINIDISTAFLNNPLLFRNFLVDLANHPELAWGVFGGHMGNAPPIAALNEDSQEGFLKVIKDFDTVYASLAENEKDSMGRMFIMNLSSEIIDQAYTSNPFNWDSDYYQFINLYNIIQSRIELRSFRPQKSIYEFLLQISFLEERINFLKSFNKPIDVNIPKRWQLTNTEKQEKFNGMLNEMQLPEASSNQYKSLLDNMRKDMPYSKLCYKVLN